MTNKSNKSFMESFMSFLRKSSPKDQGLVSKTVGVGTNHRKSSPKDQGLVGKIVGVDTNHRSSDGYNLIHIYRIVDSDGKRGAFLGNIKYKSKMSLFRKNTRGEFVENIEAWRELTPKEMKMVTKF